MNANPYISIFVMAGITYFIRLLPITLIQKEIKNRTLRSFLYYMPYVTLAVMVFPAILAATASIWSALGGLVIAVVLSYGGHSLFKVSLSACLAVFVIELLILSQ